MKKYVHNIVEREKKIPVISEADLVVVGGGIAGCAAALAASRLGVKTILIEKELALGGLATLGNVIVYLSLCDGMGRQVMGGIAEEFIKLSVSDGFHSIPSSWVKGGDPEGRRFRRYRTDFNPANLILELEKVLLDAGVEIWFDCRFCDLVCDDNRINALLLENKSGRVALKCKTVLDCSGDADVCARAGEKTESLKTNVECGWFFHFESDEDSVGGTEAEVGNQEMPSSLGFEGRTLRLKLNSFSKPYSKNPRTLPEGSRGYAGDDFGDVSDHVIESRKLIRKEIEKIKENSKGKSIYPAILPVLPSLRMTRRLAGQTEIKIEDEFRYFDDSVGMAGDWRRNG